MEQTVKVSFGKSIADNLKRKGIKLRRADHTGDTTLAVMDPDSEQSIQVGTDELDKFWQTCINEFGKAPPIFAGRAVEGQDELSWCPWERDKDGYADVRELLVTYPLVGG